MTAPFQHVIDLVHRLGPSFLERAPRHDRDGSFVADNYAELKANKFFSLAVPSELGGGGLGHREASNVVRELAQYCPSTALALSMHTHIVAANVWRFKHGLPAEALLRKVASSELVLVSTGAGDWLDSVGRAEAVAGGYRVSGIKRFCSGVLAGDLLITSAPLDDGKGGAEVLHFPVPVRAQGVSIRNDWDALGMRGTGSHSVELLDVFVPEETVSVRRPRGKWHGSWSVITTVAPAIYMAPYVGAAQHAVALTRAALASKAPDAVQLTGLGEVENELLQAQLAWQCMLDIANDYEFEPKLEDANRVLMCKTLTANAVQRCVAKAIEVVGGSAFFRECGLERLLRDVQAAPFHLLSEKRQQLFSGQVALGLPPSG